jgi:hypothetical protein
MKVPIAERSKNVSFPASCVPEHNHGILEGISNREFSSWKFRELVRSAGLRVRSCQRAHQTVLRQSYAPCAGNDSFFVPRFARYSSGEFGRLARRLIHSC